jgi:lipopolysaccharide export system protein LptA
MSRAKYVSRMLLLSAVLAQPCLAERADREKPMHLEADGMVVDDARKVSTFTGNVQLVQGTMLIRGDKIVVVEGEDGLKVATVHGNTASFRQKREGLDEYVEGYGERIVYNERTEIVDFYVKARVVREGDDVRGEHITYNQKTEIFRVNSGSAGEDGVPKRVRAVLQPKPRSGAAAASAVPGTMPIAPSTTFTPMEQE